MNNQQSDLSDRVKDANVRKGEIPLTCDALTCVDRGNIPRCYLDIYKYCRRYELLMEQRYNGRNS